MSEQTTLEETASQTVTALLTALQNGDAEAYYNLMSHADQEMMDAESIGQSMREMQQQSGRLQSFKVQGIVLHEAAGHASAHVLMDFELTGQKSDLYNLTRQGSEWKMDFDLAELMGEDQDV